MPFKDGSLRKREKTGCLCLCDVVHKIAQGEKLAASWRRESSRYQRLLKAYLTRCLIS